MAGESIAQSPVAIIQSADPSFQETLAAQEIRRYVYLRTGSLLPILGPVSIRDDAIVLGLDKSLQSQQYRLKTVSENDHKILHITGGSSVAVLYGAYHFVETLGVRFRLHGDVIPDKKIAFVLPQLNEIQKPLFDIRGILPFHDFPEGPDWWSLDDYKAYITQLAKMRMNFIGFHCYPPKGDYSSWDYGPEPQVWVGLPEDVNPDGTVRFSYPTRLSSTFESHWGYNEVKTNQFSAGAVLLFPEEEYGPWITLGNRPWPKTVKGANEVFNRNGRLFNEAFSFARSMGVKTCVGLEAPFQLPVTLQDHLKQKGLNPKDPKTIKQLIKGMITRIERTHPLDYFWFWTSERFLGVPPKPHESQRIINDIKITQQILNEKGNPFVFGTSGWMLGLSDPLEFDRILDKNNFISVLNEALGFYPVDENLSLIKGRSKWAIPWIEDDPAIIAPQLWAGRVRQNAADAHAYGCDGLIGLLWRTKILSSQLTALKNAGWDQAEWNKQFGTARTPQVNIVEDKRIGGKTAVFSNTVIKNADSNQAYSEQVYGLSNYNIKIPNGTYRITLKFCELHYKSAGKRVFDVKLQGKKVIDSLDIFAKTGPNVALDYTFENIDIENESLHIEFNSKVEYPLISAIVIDGHTRAFNQLTAMPYSRALNCGGDAITGTIYGKDLQLAKRHKKKHSDVTKEMPVDDHYRDWCRGEFGGQAAEYLIPFFKKLDGGAINRGVGHLITANLPRPSKWDWGPGSINTDSRPWEVVSKEYAFVDQIQAIRPKVNGAGNLARFDYWLNVFKYLRAMGQAGCARHELHQAVVALDNEKVPQTKRELVLSRVLPVRIKLARLWEQMMMYRLETVDTPGGLGTISNLEQHVLRNSWTIRKHVARNASRFLDEWDSQIQESLDQPLPAAVHPTKKYLGKPRIIVPTIRNVISHNENISLKVIVLDNERPRTAHLYWREMGKGDFKAIPLTHVGRAVYKVHLPVNDISVIEYYIRAVMTNDKLLIWPASAPEINQTIIVLPPKPMFEFEKSN